jgi:hypothetical protein
MTVAFLTADLVFPSRVAGITQRLGAELIVAATIESLAAKLEKAAPPVIALLDLNSMGADPSTIVPRLKALANPPSKIIAFGPHVHEARLAAAEMAGCDLVLTRGQFDAQMDRLITDCSSAG